MEARQRKRKRVPESDTGSSDTSEEDDGYGPRPGDIRVCGFEIDIWAFRRVLALRTDLALEDDTVTVEPGWSEASVAAMLRFLHDDDGADVLGVLSDVDLANLVPLADDMMLRAEYRRRLAEHICRRVAFPGAWRPAHAVASRIRQLHQAQLRMGHLCVDIYERGGV